MSDQPPMMKTMNRTGMGGTKSESTTPTEKERRFVEGVAKGQSPYKAALAAGYAPSTAKSKSYKIIRSHRVQSFLTDALERLEVTPDMIVRPIVEALQATKTVRVKTPQGTLEVKTDEPDHRVRLEAYDRIERLYGVTLTRPEVPVPAKGNLTVVIVRASDLERAAAAQKAKVITSGQLLEQPKVLNVQIAKRTNGGSDPTKGTSST
jgi:phage terminase small subunit